MASDIEKLFKLDISNLLEKDKTLTGNTEFEFRFGYYTNDRFISKIPSKDFYRILKHFIDQKFTTVSDPILLKTGKILNLIIPESLYNPVPIFESVFTINGEHLRESNVEYQFPPQYETPYFISSKKTLNTLELKNINARFSKSLEKDLAVLHSKVPATNPIPQGAYPDIQRRKHRWSFETNNSSSPFYPFRIDMTKVENIKQDKSLVTEEIELELIRPVSDGGVLWEGVKEMIKLIQDSEFPITVDNIQNVKDSFNNLFQKDIEDMEMKKSKNYKVWKFNKNKLYNPVNKPENIKINNLEDPTNLAITDKADGERKLMYVRQDGIFLLFPPNDVMKFMKLDDEYKQFINCVFDGELVTIKNKRKYLVFDILIDQGKDVRNLIFEKRLNILKGFFNKTKFPAELKYYSLPNEGNFYNRVKKILDSISSKQYGNDGLIFNNVLSSYYGKVYKWKPEDKLTLDFQTEKVGQGPKGPIFNLMIKDSNKGGLILFSPKGDEYPFVVNEKTNPKKLIINDKNIVEMSFNKDLYDGQGGFVAQRIRYDRDEPNNSVTAYSVWSDIVDPLTKASILGTDLKLMRKLHNSVKRTMIQELGKGAYILDIGSGFGGDIPKWKDIGANVLAVEPNNIHLEEFNKRMIEYGYILVKNEQAIGAGIREYIYNPVKPGEESSKIVSLNTEGQDFDNIITTFKTFFGKNRGPYPANAVDLFNSLTFFYDSENSLDSLVTSIDQLLGEDGVVQGIVMDGEMVKQLFDPAYLLRKRLLNLQPEEYLNLKTNTVGNVNVVKGYKNEKYHLESPDVDLLNDTVKDLDTTPKKEINYQGWSIKDVGDNKVVIDLQGAKTQDKSLVENQTEYLVDLQPLINKLADKNIDLVDEHFIAGSGLPESQKVLNHLYRVFKFVRKFPKAEFKESNLPLVGNYTKIIRTNKVFIKHLQDAIAKLETDIPHLADTSLKQAQDQLETRKQKLQKYITETEQLENKIKSLSQTKISETPDLAKKITPYIIPTKLLKVADPTQVKVIYDHDTPFKSNKKITTILKPGETQEIEIKKIKFNRTGLYNKKSMLYGTLLASLESFKKAPEKNRTDTLNNVKLNIIKQIKTLYDNKDASIKTLSSFYSSSSDGGWEEALKVLKDSANWYWLDLTKALSNIIKHNIVIVHQEKPETYKIKKYDGKFKKSIYLFYHDGVFELLTDDKNNGLFDSISF